MEKDEKVQARLKSGVRHLTAWVDRDVKVGQYVTLRDSDNPLRMWEVLSVSEPKKSKDIKSSRDYNVGGLDKDRNRK